MLKRRHGLARFSGKRRAVRVLQRALDARLRRHGAHPAQTHTRRRRAGRRVRGRAQDLRRGSHAGHPSAAPSSTPRARRFLANTTQAGWPTKRTTFRYRSDFSCMTWNTAPSSSIASAPRAAPTRFESSKTSSMRCRQILAVHPMSECRSFSFRDQASACVGASSWGASLTADCFDPEVFGQFYQDHLGKGPEDLCNQGVALTKDPCD